MKLFGLVVAVGLSIASIAAADPLGRGPALRVTTTCSPLCTRTCDCHGNPRTTPLPPTACAPTCTATCDCSGKAIAPAPSAGTCSPQCTPTCDCSGNPIAPPSNAKCSPLCTRTCDCHGNTRAIPLTATACTPTCTATCDCSGNPIAPSGCTPTCTSTCDCSGNPIAPAPTVAPSASTVPATNPEAFREAYTQRALAQIAATIAKDNKATTAAEADAVSGHWIKTMRILRIRELAQVESDAAVVKRCDDQLARADRNLALRLQSLNTKAPVKK